MQYEWYLKNNLAELDLTNFTHYNMNQLASHIISQAYKEGRMVFIADANLYDEVKTDDSHNNVHLIEWWTMKWGYLTLQVLIYLTVRTFVDESIKMESFQYKFQSWGENRVFRWINQLF